MAVAAQPLETLEGAPTSASDSTDLLEQLKRAVAPERVLTRPVELIAFASDASFYRLIPRAVVLSQGISEIQEIFRISHASRVPVTFRAGGTSLCGQSITD